jgi:DNA-binding transcriptional regulator YiaG
MPNIGTLLKEEISRLCRREIRRQVGPIRKASAGYRREIAALKRQVQDLDRRAKSLAKRKPGVAVETSSDQRPMRFVAKGLRSMRTRLGLSAPELAQLIGVSGQSIYNWEQKKATPRKEQLAMLAGLRPLGKREARERLEGTKGTRVRRKLRKK